MNIGLFLSLGESFSDLKSKGQDQLMVNQQIFAFAKKFKRVYVFTYKKETIKLPKNCTLVTPPYKLHRYLYGVLMPFIHKDIFSRLDALRCYQLFGTLPGLIAKIFFDKKLIFNYGYDYLSFAQLESKPTQAIAVEIFTPFALKYSDYVIIKNKKLVSKIKTFTQNYTILPNGVDTNKFKPRNRTDKNLSILFVARLEPQKNIFALLQAISSLKTKPHLTIIGNGSLKKKVSHFIKKNHLNSTLKSKVPHQQMPKIYSSEDIFVLPSIKEGSSKVLLEAMASGLACIATNIPENQEIIQTNKIHVLFNIV